MIYSDDTSDLLVSNYASMTHLPLLLTFSLVCKNLTLDLSFLILFYHGFLCCPRLLNSLTHCILLNLYCMSFQDAGLLNLSACFYVHTTVFPWFLMQILELFSAFRNYTCSSNIYHLHSYLHATLRMFFL